MSSTAEDWPLDALPEGTQLFGYRIGGILGRGGFGITYRAIDSLEQVFAVKECFPSQFAIRQGTEVRPRDAPAAEGLSDCLSRFVREARALLQLSRIGAAGDSVVKVLTSFQTNGTAYIVMEFLDGRSLDALVGENPAGIPEARLEPIVSGLLHAVDCAHQAGLLHRDIKPSNVLLRDDGRPVLIDFGSVRAVGPSHTGSFTQIFSQRYAPIEQIIGGPQGPYSDIYAIGATCYRAIGGVTVGALIRHHSLLRGQPDPLPPAITVGGGRYRESALLAIDAALRVAPEDRPQTVRDFRELRRLPNDDATVRRALTGNPSFGSGDTGRDGSTKRGGLVPISATGLTHSDGSANQGQSTAADKEADIVEAATPASTGVEEFIPLSASAAVSAEQSRAPLTPDLPAQSPAIDSAYPGKWSITRGRRWLLVAGILFNVIVGIGLTIAFAPALLPQRNGAASADAPLVTGLETTGSKAMEPGSADPGNAFDQGMRALDQKNYPYAMAMFRKAADRGHAFAQDEVGLLYANGQGTPQDYVKALAWYRMAADHGLADAQYNIGVLYATGRGVTQDFAEAARWFQRAAEQNHAEAEYNLGSLYERGFGVPRDLGKAVYWYRRAAEQNHSVAEYYLAICYAEGRGTPQDLIRAAGLFRRAAEQGVVPAMVNLATFLQQGKGVAISLIESYAWYEAAATRGNKDAERRAVAVLRRLGAVDRRSAAARAEAIDLELPKPATPR